MLCFQIHTGEWTSAHFWVENWYAERDSNFLENRGALSLRIGGPSPREPGGPLQPELLHAPLLVKVKTRQYSSAVRQNISSDTPSDDSLLVSHSKIYIVFLSTEIKKKKYQIKIGPYLIISTLPANQWKSAFSSSV